MFFFFFFNDTATTEIYTLSLHDALPISKGTRRPDGRRGLLGPAGSKETRKIKRMVCKLSYRSRNIAQGHARSEEHTSELQSRQYLVCRLLLEKKKKTNTTT